jgi:hypothetical protein
MAIRKSGPRRGRKAANDIALVGIEIPDPADLIPSIRWQYDQADGSDARKTFRLQSKSLRDAKTSVLAYVRLLVEGTAALGTTGADPDAAVKEFDSAFINSRAIKELLNSGTISVDVAEEVLASVAEVFVYGLIRRYPGAPAESVDPITSMPTPLLESCYRILYAAATIARSNIQAEKLKKLLRADALADRISELAANYAALLLHRRHVDHRRTLPRDAGRPKEAVGWLIQKVEPLLDTLPSGLRNRLLAGLARDFLNSKVTQKHVTDIKKATQQRLRSCRRS